MSERQNGEYADVAHYKMERAKDELESAVILLEAGKYKAANNRAYYSCFHAMGAILALEPTAFKKHRDVMSYFNKNYVHTGVFPKEIGRKLSRLEIIRHKSDYDDFYIASREEAAEQIQIADEVYHLLSNYIIDKTK